MVKYKKKWIVYIILAENNYLYTGITTDIERRFQEHLDNKKRAKFFRTTKPKKLVYQEILNNRSEASKREMEIKKLSRKEKDKLIEKYFKN